MNNKRNLKIITVLIPIVIIVLFILQNYIFAMIDQLPTCIFYSFFHLYCPACGNTRSFHALLHGNLITSLRYNIVPLLLVVLSFLCYIELATYSFGKYKRLLPRKLSFYMIGFALLLLYLVVRNFIPFLTP